MTEHSSEWLVLPRKMAYQDGTMIYVCMPVWGEHLRLGGLVE